MAGIAQADIVVNLMIFIMSAFLGLELIRHVSRLLHTPLMALTNAISSVSIVAALIVMSLGEARAGGELVVTLTLVAVALATTNVVSGFMITERILRMFKRRGE
ncbi:MAG: NAD(P) transhydrogenase subunit alpha [Halobacteria archaeon]